MILKKIRLAFFRKSLEDMLAGSTRSRRAHNLSTARKIGILFDATEEQARQDILKMADSFEPGIRQVSMLGFFNIRQPAPTTAFKAFTRKDLDWAGRPKAAACSDFADHDFDLLLCFNPSQAPALEWVAVQTKAAMKIGMPTSLPNDYDLQLEVPAGKGPLFFLEQLEHYLGALHLKKHEPV